MIRYILSIALIHCCATIALGQESVQPRPSPVAIASLRFKTTYIKITYGQPHKNGRAIFGALVPLGQLWRTGANEATEMTITKDITINSVLLKAGTYSLFTIPDKDKWTIIINADLGMWGSYNYNAKQDVVRFDVPVQTSAEVFEAFTIQLEQTNDMANLLIQWDKTKVSIPIKFFS